MPFEVEYTDEFQAWWNGLSETGQDAVKTHVDALARFGPALGRPWVDTLRDRRSPT